MTAPPAPPSGRRASFGAAAVLAGFVLLAPPLYVLGPFALITLLSRPRTLREWFWLVFAGLGIALVLNGDPALGPRVLRVSGVALSAAYGIQHVRGMGSVLQRAITALVVTAIALTIWAAVAGVTWSGVELAFTDLLRNSYNYLVQMAGTDPQARRDMENFVKPFLERAPEVARLMPGFLAVEGLAGLALAALWHDRISSRANAHPPAPFRAFRFNDHFVWGAIFTLALLLAPLPPTGAAVAANLLVVWIGLYAARGLAIISAVLAPAPLPLRVLTGALAFLMIPVALGACVALGLADTWLDIRGRLLPPATEGA
jgi:hypothetical protein